SRWSLSNVVRRVAITSPSSAGCIDRRGRPAVRAAGPAAGLDHTHILRLVALAPGANLELDPLSLLQTAIPRAGNVRIVNEDVRFALTGDEAVTLLGVEKLHDASSHDRTLFTHAPAGRLAATSTLGPGSGVEGIGPRPDCTNYSMPH